MSKPSLISVSILHCRKLLLVLFVITSVAAQEYPQDLDFSYRTDALLDAGYLWDVNSSFHPLRASIPDSLQQNLPDPGVYKWLHGSLFKHGDRLIHACDESENGLSLFLIPGIGLYCQSGAVRQYDSPSIEPFLWSQIFIHRKWYAKLFVRATNEAASLAHYSGVTRDIERAGFNTGEFDRALIGYDNGFVKAEFGRGRQIWGPLPEENLMLAGGSLSWEQLSLGLKYKKFNFRYFFGALSTEYDDENNVNIQRYIAGRAVEYRNFRNLVVSAGEVSTFAGPDRPIDFALLNPLALHLEVESNDRENNQARNSSNSFLFLNIDWLLWDQLRASGTFLLDELQIDQADRDRGVDDALGFMTRFAWTILQKPMGITIIAQGMKIDSHVYKAQYGYANLVNFGSPMGHSLGNDAEDYSIGARLVFRYPLILEAAYGKRRWGDASMKYQPYEGYPSDHPRGPFPTGDIRTNTYLKIKLDSQLWSNFQAGLDGWIDISHDGPTDSELERYTFTLRYLLPLVFTGL